MNNLLKKIALLVLAGVVTSSISAQEKKGVEFNVSGDFVSSYVWRGMYQTNAAVQPTLGVGIGGLSLTAWGSTDFTGDAKEIDLTLAYSFHNFTISVADLWWPGQGSKKYFHFESDETDHHFEAGLSYTLPCQKLPLSISWYTMFAGQDKKINDRGEIKQNYSSYAELNYPFEVKGIALNATLGCVPYQSEAQYGVSGFAITNVALKATKEVKLSSAFSLPLFAQVIFNPAREDAHLVLGFTIR